MPDADQKELRFALREGERILSKELHDRFGGARTSVDDFAMQCPNCHAEIHLPREDGTYRTLEELKNALHPSKR